MIQRHHHIPVEILIEIIKRINDLKSLIRWRSVSKAWKSLIDSKDFIAAHTTFLVSQPKTQHHRLLVRYGDLDKSGYKYVSFVDDDSFRHGQKVTLFAPHSVTFFDYSSVSTRLVGSSHGLLCFYDTLTTKKAVIWNPSIRKSVAVTLPNVLTDPYTTLVGFGVCPHTLDPKLVKLNYFTYGIELEYRNNSVIPHFYCAVWMMTGQGYSKSFKMVKLFNYGSPDTLVFTALGFTKSGAPIIEIIVDMDQDISKLSVYEPCSQQNHDIGIYGIWDGCSFFLNSYIETLLLLDQ